MSGGIVRPLVGLPGGAAQEGSWERGLVVVAAGAAPLPFHLSISLSLFFLSLLL
jgi:hypothetical protein